MAVGLAATVVEMDMAKVPAGDQDLALPCGWGQFITSCSTISTNTVTSATVGSTQSTPQLLSTRIRKPVLKEGRCWRWSPFLFRGEVQMEVAATILLLSLREWEHYSVHWMGAACTIRPFCHLSCAATAVRHHLPIRSSVGAVLSTIHWITRHLSTQSHKASCTSSWDSTVRKQKHTMQTQRQKALITFCFN